MKVSGHFLYGFIETDAPIHLGPNGIDGGETYAVSHEGISALVSPVGEFDMDALPKAALLRTLALYQATIEKVMSDYPVLPAKFGTILEGNEEIQSLLNGQHSEILQNLHRIRGMIELDLVALWADMDGLLREIGNEEEVRRLKDVAESCAPEQALEIRIKTGRQVKALLDVKARARKKEIVQNLLMEAEDHCHHPVMDEFMILNTAFLLRAEREESFLRGVRRMDREYRDAIRFKIVGPLPPYSFCTMEIVKAEFGAVEEARRCLCLGEEGTPEEIRDAFWELSRRFHPDNRPGDSEAPKYFEKLHKAYRFLSGYCGDGRASFREKDVREWLRVRLLEKPARNDD